MLYYDHVRSLLIRPDFVNEEVHAEEKWVAKTRWIVRQNLRYNSMGNLLGSAKKVRGGQLIGLRNRKLSVTRKHSLEAQQELRFFFSETIFGV